MGKVRAAVLLLTCWALAAPLASPTPTLAAALENEPAHEAAVTAETDVDGIERLRDGWVRALNSEALDAVVAGFADGAVVQIERLPLIFDRDAIRAWYRSLFAETELRYNFVTETLRVDGDWAFEEWSATVAITPVRDGAPAVMGDTVQFVDRGLRVYRRGPDGSWGIDREVWFGDHPFADRVAAIFDELLRRAS